MHVIREDPVNPDLLYVGTDVGLHVSLDQGRSWRRWQNGLPTTPVHDLKVHPRDRELIVATHGRSIWIVDVAPLQQLDTRAVAAAPVLFEPAPGLLYGSRPVVSSIGGEYYGHSWFRGDNKPFGAEIVWFNPTAGDSVRITIADASGTQVQTLVGSGAQGLQRVFWNFRRTPERPARTLSPSERRDSIMTVRRAEIVADSLIAAGEPEQLVRRVAGLLKGEVQEAATFGFGGGGAGGGGMAAFAGDAQRPWADRPGEGSVSGGGGGQFGEVRRLLGVFRASGPACPAHRFPAAEGAASGRAASHPPSPPVFTTSR